MECRDGCSESDPGDDGTDEWCGGEYHLASSGAELAGALDPLGDREPVTAGADGERSKNFGWCGAGAPADEGETDGQVGGPRDETFQRDDVFGGEVLDACGDAVVETPAA